MMLLLFCGLPGTGKTTLAAAFARWSGWRHLHSDRLRREMNLMGDYSPQAKERVYQALFEQTESALRNGENIIVDSTFYRQSVRQPFISIARKYEAPFLFVETTASESTIRARVSRPRPDSEADFAVYETLRDQFEPIREAHLQVSTETEAPDTLAFRLIDELSRQGLYAIPVIGESDIRRLMDRGAFPGERDDNMVFVQTHISWVILTRQFAFKIKKNVRYPFLDFSTLERRKHFCDEELRLNSRLAPDMYLSVLPVTYTDGQYQIGETNAPIADFALQMRRMDNRLEMDRLLESGGVEAEDLIALADVLSDFHLQHRLFSIPPDLNHPDRKAVFDDLFSCEKDLERLLGAAGIRRLRQLSKHAAAFLDRHADRLNERMNAGYWVDGHGDLHAKNIFLTQPPVVFDGIEFNREFRMIDVLDELAFLCMDLHFFNRPDLETVFLSAYHRRWNTMPQPEDAALFRFFKANRANIRLKVTLLELRQHGGEALDRQAKLYAQLLFNELDQL